MTRWYSKGVDGHLPVPPVGHRSPPRGGAAHLATPGLPLPSREMKMNREDSVSDSGVDREGRIVVLTGAGISAESGLATFRGAGGLWEGHRVEEVATPEAFARNPQLVHRFYNERRRRLLDV